MSENKAKSYFTLIHVLTLLIGGLGLAIKDFYILIYIFGYVPDIWQVVNILALNVLAVSMLRYFIGYLIVIRYAEKLRDLNTELVNVIAEKLLGDE